MADERNNVLLEDTGCHLHPSCLACPEVPPLSMCVFDFPGYEKGWRQYKEIKKCLLIEHLSIEETSKKLGMKKKYIEDMLKRVESVLVKV